MTNPLHPISVTEKWIRSVVEDKPTAELIIQTSARTENGEIILRPSTPELEKLIINRFPEGQKYEFSGMALKNHSAELIKLIKNAMDGYLHKPDLIDLCNILSDMSPLELSIFQKYYYDISTSALIQYIELEIINEHKYLPKEVRRALVNLYWANTEQADIPISPIV